MWWLELVVWVEVRVVLVQVCCQRVGVREFGDVVFGVGGVV